jgi:ribosome-binding factor A
VIGVEVSGDLKGYVYVETLNGTDAEARRAMALLGVASDVVFTTGA